MSDKVSVEVLGKSSAEVAHQMAIQMLMSVEGKKWGEFNRREYLNAHAQAADALRGIHFE